MSLIETPAKVHRFDKEKAFHFNSSKKPNKAAVNLAQNGIKMDNWISGKKIELIDPKRCSSSKVCGSFKLVCDIPHTSCATQFL